jgi:hypothetical protein
MVASVLDGEPSAWLRVVPEDAPGSIGVGSPIVRTYKKPDEDRCDSQ